MLRPLLISTLFPYTTLFRSRHLENLDRVIVLAQEIVDPDQHPLSRLDFSLERFRRAGDLPLEPAALARSAEADRKSTRLNSSHLGISYAVFCLKKKKTQQIK